MVSNRSSRRRAWLGAIVALGLCACAPNGPSQEALGNVAMNAGGAREQRTPASDASIGDDCSTVRGARYSPGGSVLPNRCAPFHPTLNNPYAVRCVDALSNFESGFAGDDACILPPPPDKGVQVGMHPQGNSDAYWAAIHAGDMSGYATADDSFLLAQGEQDTRNYRTRAGDGAAHAYYRIYYRLRAGGHHTIITLHESDAPEGWVGNVSEESLPGFATELFTLLANLGGQQRMDENTPPTFDKPPEDRGLYFEWPVEPAVMINYHGFNATDETLLRETWINVWWEEDQETLGRWFLGYELPQVISLSIAPETVADLHYAMGVATDTRLLSLLGHRHAWTSNMSAWVARGDGSTELLYQSFDWTDVPTYRYDSLSMNPEVASEARTDGGASGVTLLQAGDVLHFNCHVEYTQERALEVGAPFLPSEQGRLLFANQVYGGEMCVLFGTVTGSPFEGFPVFDLTRPPEFAMVN